MFPLTTQKGFSLRNVVLKIMPRIVKVTQIQSMFIILVDETTFDQLHGPYGMSVFVLNLNLSHYWKDIP
jgi:hypothetical protein